MLISLHIAVMSFFVAHILLRENRQPESRMAWLVVVAALPYVGVLAYMLLGRTSVGRRRVELLTQAFEKLPRPDPGPELIAPTDPYEQLFEVGRSISGYPAVEGNRARLLPGENEAIDAMIADIDAARHHVHVLFYIWLADGNGRRVAEALMRAARRGVPCRALVDDLGSRRLVRHVLWDEMRAAGVQTRRALSVGNPVLRVLDGRIDIRNHRKVLIVDNRITYCGSQNCADPEFLPKAKFGPWVDAVVRFEGPLARQAQHLFASDWMGNGGEDLAALLAEPPFERQPDGLAAPAGVRAQVIGTGPTFRASAMPELFSSLIFAARHELVVTTPYYVPNTALQSALCASANRGVATTLILPAHNDDLLVGAASRSYFPDLLKAGVRLFEFQPGLLHAKTLTVDGRLSLIGSANMDRRSFDLNYENSVLVDDVALTAEIRARQALYQKQSLPVLLEEVADWSIGRRILNNATAIFGPVL